MNAKDKEFILKRILETFPSTEPEFDIDWDMLEISFKAGQLERKEQYEKRIKDLQETCAQWERLSIDSRKAGVKEVVEWLKQYAIHGGNTPLDTVLIDLKEHSPYWLKRNGE